MSVDHKIGRRAVDGVAGMKYNCDSHLTTKFTELFNVSSTKMWRSGFLPFSADETFYL